MKSIGRPTGSQTRLRRRLVRKLATASKAESPSGAIFKLAQRDASLVMSILK